MTDETDHLTKAAEQVRSGEPQAAARSLRFASRSPDLHVDDERLGALTACLWQVAESMGLGDLEAAARAAGELDPEALYALGYELIEVGLPEVAVPVLQRVNLELPNQGPVVSELAASLHGARRHGEARDLLLGNPEFLEEFWLRYFLILNSLCAGDLPTAARHASPLRSTEAEHEGAEVRVRAMLGRAARLESVFRPADFGLREWQYVLNGCVLLHLSAFGFDEGMNGRYAFSQDGVGAIRRDLESLVAALRAVDSTPSRVLTLPERGSRILGAALGAMLGVPVEAWSAGRAGLVVAYDLRDLEEGELAALAGAAGLSLFARSVRWTQPCVVVPSYVGLLAQTMMAPWSAGLRATAEGGVERTAESDEPPEVWARRILAADPGGDEVAPGDSAAERLRFFGVAVAEPSDMFLEGPIRSNRFG